MSPPRPIRNNAAERRTAQLQLACDACAEFMARVLELERQRDSGVPGTWPRETGAIRRQSMEVTRALATLRREWSLHH